jgi:hypothetical protein
LIGLPDETGLPVVVATDFYTVDAHLEPICNYIKIHEPEAFMMITNSSEVIGKGFRGLN